MPHHMDDTTHQVGKKSTLRDESSTKVKGTSLMVLLQQSEDGSFPHSIGVWVLYYLTSNVDGCDSIAGYVGYLTQEAAMIADGYEHCHGSRNADSVEEPCRKTRKGINSIHNHVVDATQHEATVSQNAVPSKQAMSMRFISISLKRHLSSRSIRPPS